MKEINLNKIIISHFLDLKETNSDTNILSELESIKKGVHKEQVLAARFYYKKDHFKYAQLKKKLPAVTFSGRYNKKRTGDYLIAYTSFIIIDIDKIDDLELLNKLKSDFFTEEFVAAVWLSPSGAGLKVLVKIEPSIEYHTVAFHSLVNYFNKKYGVSVDTSGSDVSRLCFSSYDENLLMKKSVTDYSEQQIIENSEDLPLSKTATTVRAIDLPTLDKSYNFFLKNTTGRNNFKDRSTLQAILKYLKLQKKSITTNYDQWFRVALAIANSFTFDLGSKYFMELCRLDGEAHDEEKSFYMLKYCYLNRRLNAVNFGTIVHLAQGQGFDLKHKATLKSKKV